MLECVANLSEGRRASVIAALASASGDALLDLHADADHHRSVFTLAARTPGATEASARRLAEAAAGLLDVADGAGVHPRLGAIDVVPFVALDGSSTEDAVGAAGRFATWIADRLDVPAFLYDDADPMHRSLPSLRRDAFVHRAPDAGPDRPHPRLGGVAVGARPPLVAVNCELDSADVALASAIARAVRERDGGLPGVRALGFELRSRDRAQVSMNLVELAATGLERAVTEVRDRAERGGARVARLELVGLIPEAELTRCSATFLAWSGLGADQTVEGRLRATSVPD